ncbi:hypothetical protein N0V84_006984 [Fusarium piperis]|uniref:Uncharacterized protein n=1 Tax=Fusarium piperis TaxID=1435070 RepID=A0A9W9BN05_9HYPO|nr:hypothetical protein N0V84_006984 [Fusarium piperis]
MPHDWLFDRVSTECHHGGADTCSTGIKAGRPTVVVPFFGDQSFWGAMVSRAGAGPEPIPHAELTAEKLAAAIRYRLLPETQAKTQELGARIRDVAGTAEGCRSFHRWLQSHKLVCDTALERCAAWKVKGTAVKLSPFSAAVLVRAGELEYSDLNLSVEYSTEEQPSDPFSATTAAIMRDMSSIAAGIATSPREVIKVTQASDKRGKSPSPRSSLNAQEPPNAPGSSEMHASQQLHSASGDDYIIASRIQQVRSGDDSMSTLHCTPRPSQQLAISPSRGINGEHPIVLEYRPERVSNVSHVHDALEPPQVVQVNEVWAVDASRGGDKCWVVSQLKE